MRRLDIKRALTVIAALILALIVSMLTYNRLSIPQAQNLGSDIKPTAGLSGQSDEARGSQGKHKIIDRNGIFSSRNDVALYLVTYGFLPKNFITKAQARALGWQGGDLRPYAEDVCIGGDIFNNYEGLLPKEKGRVYYECDIDTLGRDNRGAKRIIYSNDGLIYFTDDHYKSFILLYGEDEHAGDQAGWQENGQQGADTFLSEAYAGAAGILWS